MDKIRHELKYYNARWKEIFDADLDIEVFDTRLQPGHLETPGLRRPSSVATSTSTLNEVSQDCNRNASPQSSHQSLPPATYLARRRSLRRPLRRSFVVTAQNSPDERSRARTQSKRAGKQRRVETNDFDTEKLDYPEKVLPIVQYDFPLFGEINGNYNLPAR